MENAYGNIYEDFIQDNKKEIDSILASEVGLYETYKKWVTENVSPKCIVSYRTFRLEFIRKKVFSANRRHALLDTA